MTPTPDVPPAAEPTHCADCGGRLNRRGECLLCPMFASGRAPTCVSDTTRFPGHLLGGRQFGTDHVREAYMAEARKAGVNVDGKMYFSSLAAYPGDPRAWCDSEGEQRRLLEERGWSSSGDLTVKGREVAPAPRVRLADDLVEEHVERELEQRYPDADGVRIKRQEFEDIKEAVIEKHGAPAGA